MYTHPYEQCELFGQHSFIELHDPEIDNDLQFLHSEMRRAYLIIYVCFNTL